jgi:hypothetical protein
MNVRNQKACKLLGQEKFIHGMTALSARRFLLCVFAALRETSDLNLAPRRKAAKEAAT